MKVIINGKEYVEKAAEETTYSIGDRFKFNGRKYILSVTGRIGGCPTVAFIHLDFGTRWEGDTMVADEARITESQLQTISGGYVFTRYWDSERKIYTGEKKG